MQQAKEQRLQMYIALGLSTKEATIYDLLLELGELSARTIELTTGFKKNTYQLLRALLKKNLVLKKQKDLHVYYEATSPDELRRLAQQAIRTAQWQAKWVHEALPHLLKMYEVNTHKPSLTYVEGPQDVRELYRELYGELAAPSYGCLDLERMNQAIPDLMDTELIPTRAQKRAKAYALLSDNVAGRATHARDEMEERESRLLDPSRYPLPAEISVYKDKVVLLSFRKGKTVGYVIRDPDMVVSLTSVYRYLFDQGK